MNKVSSKIIKERIYNILGLDQPSEQAGFRKGYSTVDHIQNINQVIEKATKYIDVYLLFIDFRKAFDTINHKRIWEALAIQGIPIEIIKVLKNAYENVTAYIT